MDSSQADLQPRPDEALYNVSCRWIRDAWQIALGARLMAKDNRERWNSWIPVQTACYAGYGVVDSLGKHLLNRTLGHRSPLRSGTQDRSSQLQCMPGRHFGEQLASWATHFKNFVQWPVAARVSAESRSFPSISIAWLSAKRLGGAVSVLIW